jgi:excisionase family DNA binding protein
MNVQEYARTLGRSERRVRDLIAQGKLSATREGRSWNIDAQALPEAKTQRKHLVIPDCQVKAGVPLEHLTWIGKYIADKRPDVVVQIGDFADMPSLSSYDRGKKSFEGRRYKTDIDAARRAMDLLMEPVHKVPGYRPYQLLTLGNHEDRISRAVEDDARLDGTIGLDDLDYASNGWDVRSFLEPVMVDGVSYIHYLPTGAKGLPAPSANALLLRGHCSVTVGHIQTTDIAFRTRADGRRIIGLMAGCAYLHDEDYLPPSQNRATKRQVVMCHEVNGGEYDPMFVSLGFLKRRYA